MFFEILILLVFMVVEKFIKRKELFKFGLKFVLVVKLFFRIDEIRDVVCGVDLLSVLLMLFDDVLSILFDFVVVDLEIIRLEENVELVVFFFGMFILFMRYVFRKC